MNESSIESGVEQEKETTRSLLDQLLTNSRLYKGSKQYKELLDFVVRLRNFAPFNAMLLQIQKPGLSYAASEADWKMRFQRTIKEGARPLVILWPFAPVAFVYDVLDTEGKPLPKDVTPFVAHGEIDDNRIITFKLLLSKNRIGWDWEDAGDFKAGSIIKFNSTNEGEISPQYRLSINKNHEPAVQFATLVHELAHLYLGHLGPDKNLKIPSLKRFDPKLQEIEAESVSFLVCARNEVKSNSEVYLSEYISTNTILDNIDIYQIMRAAGQIETVLKIGSHMEFGNSSGENASKS
jgi:hypothetical protein